MGWIPPPDGIAMCQGDVGHITDRRKHPWINLDLHITEWNIRTRDYDEVGIRSASTIQEQFENMLETGVDRAFVWPVQHNTDSDLAGGPKESPVLDPDGRLTNSVTGASLI